MEVPVILPVVMVEKDPFVPVKLDTKMVEALNVEAVVTKSTNVELMILVAMSEDTVIVEIAKVDPNKVEKMVDAAFIVETFRVETTKVLPVRVETFNVDRLTVDAVSIGPEMVEKNMLLTLSEEATIDEAITVEPRREEKSVE